METIYISFYRLILLSAILGCSLPLWASTAHFGLELAHAFKPFFLVTACLLCLTGMLLLFKSKHKRFLTIFTVLSAVISLALGIEMYTDLKPLEPTRRVVPQTSCDVKILQHNVYRHANEWTKVLSLFKSTDAQVISLEEVSTEFYNQLTSEPEINTRFPFKAYRKNEELVVLSRFPISKMTFHFLGNRGYYAFTLLETTIQHRCGDFAFLVFHPPHPTSKLNYIEHRQIYQKASDILSRIKRPLIVTGDFNSTKFSPQLQQFVRQNNLINPQVALHHYFGTWPSSLPPYLRLDIDQLLVSKGIQAKEIKPLAPTESDHVPLEATILLNTLNK
ncbi:MAG: endonuclease/exonuclease/phosphatase family protein [Vampirovibrionales bacterium]